MRKSLLVIAVLFLVALFTSEAAASTVSAVSVPLAKVVHDSQLIVIASVENVANHESSLRVKYYEVRIEQVLKFPDATEPKELEGRRITVFDPREMFYHNHAEMIAAGVISFVDARYPTKVAKITVGDRLVFFLAAGDKPQKLPQPGARFLVCGQAYDTLAIKPAVLKRLK